MHTVGSGIKQSRIAFSTSLCHCETARWGNLKQIAIDLAIDYQMNTDTRIGLSNNNTYFLRISHLPAFYHFGLDNILGRCHHCLHCLHRHHHHHHRLIFVQNFVSHHTQMWFDAKRLTVHMKCFAAVWWFVCLILILMRMRKGPHWRKAHLINEKPMILRACVECGCDRKHLFIYLTCNCSTMICYVIHQHFCFYSQLLSACTFRIRALWSVKRG